MSPLLGPVTRWTVGLCPPRVRQSTPQRKLDVTLRNGLARSLWRRNRWGGGAARGKVNSARHKLCCGVGVGVPHIKWHLGIMKSGEPPRPCPGEDNTRGPNVIASALSWGESCSQICLQFKLFLLSRFPPTPSSCCLTSDSASRPAGLTYLATLRPSLSFLLVTSRVDQADEVPQVTSFTFAPLASARSQISEAPPHISRAAQFPCCSLLVFRWSFPSHE